MIIVKFRGRLGNQLFQYAFALATSKKIKTFFLIDNIHRSSFVKYFNINYLNFYNNFLLFFFKAKGIFTEDQNEKVELNLLKLQNHTYYSGFFQSEKYFENIENLLIKKFVIRKKYQLIFKKKYGEIFKEHKVIAIHCRIGDYLNNWDEMVYGSKDLTLPDAYYKNALSRINALDDYKILIVTDDVENISKRFDFIKDKTIISDVEIMDFQILQNADKVILANSSFSWWAAYLNKKNATIYAPNNWLGFKINKELPNSIISNKYIKVEFDNPI